jgi:hypothetical protein
VKRVEIARSRKETDEVMVTSTSSVEMLTGMAQHYCTYTQPE